MSTKIWLNDMAKALQEKLKTTDKIIPSEFPGKIREITGGGGENALINAPSGWEGTAVPNSGAVEKVYFNTNLNVDEVVDIIENSEITMLYQEDLLLGYACLGNAVGSIMIMIANPSLLIAKQANGWALVTGNTPDTAIFNSNSELEDTFGFVGWKPDFTGELEINSEVVSELAGMAIGQENNLISNLFSITPFEQKFEELLLEGKYDGSTVEVDVQAAGDWQGTPVPSEEGQTIEKVYLNTNLSTDKVVKIIKELFDKHPELNDSQHAMITSNIEIGLYVLTSANTNLYYIYDYINGYNVFSSAIDIENGIDFVGWNSDFDGVITPTPEDEILSSSDAIYNSEVSSLFSITPFTYLEPYIDMKSYIDNTQIPLKINLTNVATAAYVATPSGWEGTAVPTSGMLEKVYFNTNLSIDEVIAILSNPNIPIISPDNPTYLVTQTSDSKISINTVFSDNMCAIMNAVSQEVYFHNMPDYESMFGFIGWNPNVSFLEINLPIGEELGEGGMAGSNELLSQVISITPFEQKFEELLLEGKYDGSSLELDSQNFDGEAIPGDGTLTDIYVNTGLGIAEVDAVLDTIEFKNSSDYYTVYAFMKGSDSAYLRVQKGYPGYIIQNPLTNVKIYDSTGGSGSSFEGWNPDFDGLIAYAKFVEDNSYGSAETLSDNQNDKLIDLFSATPFGANEIVINLKELLAEGKIPLSIKIKL